VVVTHGSRVAARLRGTRAQEFLADAQSGDPQLDAGSHPEDPRLSALVGELSVKSEEFRRLWATHDVKDKCHGIQRLHHPLVGELDLRLESFHLADAHEQMLVTYHAEPGSPSAEALRLLASWGTDATRAGVGMPPARTA
jgi:hypothetical protein